MPAVVVTCACNFVTALLVLAIIIHLWHMALYMSHGSHYIWTQNTIFRIFIDEAFSYRYKCKWETENLRLLCKCSDFHGCNKCKLNINTLLCIFQLCILGKKFQYSHRISRMCGNHDVCFCWFDWLLFCYSEYMYMLWICNTLQSVSLVSQTGGTTVSCKWQYFKLATHFSRSQWCTKDKFWHQQRN